MSSPALARRAVIVSCSVVLALGACGVAATAALADTVASSPTSTASANPSDTPDAAAPTYTLTDNGAGTYSLAITIPGTSIAVSYTLAPSGAVATASTSTVGAVVTVNGHDLTVTLADGRAVKIELGDAGTSVDEIAVQPSSDGAPEDQPDPSSSPEQPGATPEANSGGQDGQADPATSVAPTEHSDQPDQSSSASAEPTAPEVSTSQDSSTSGDTTESGDSAPSGGSDSGS